MPTMFRLSPTGVLASLQLTDEALEALRTQGFVSPETRGGCTRFKLRYRLRGRQHVRTLGACPERAQQLRQELAVWQSARRLRCAARQCSREASQVFRGLAAQIAPAVCAAGYRLHGLQIRRPRAGPGKGSIGPKIGSVGSYSYSDSSSLSQRSALMEVEHDNAEGPVDYSYDGGQSSRQRQKIQRVLNYQSNSLAKEDPLESVIGVTNSGIMQLSLQLDEILTAAIGADPSVENLMALGPVLDSYLRTVRQIDRFSQFEERLAARGRKPQRAATSR